MLSILTSGLPPDWEACVPVCVLGGCNSYLCVCVCWGASTLTLTVTSSPALVLALPLKCLCPALLCTGKDGDAAAALEKLQIIC